MRGTHAKQNEMHCRVRLVEGEKERNCPREGLFESPPAIPTGKNSMHMDMGQYLHTFKCRFKIVIGLKVGLSVSFLFW